MTFQYWYNQGIDRKKVIAFNGAYHGDTFGSMSVGDRGPFSAPFSPFLFDVSFIDCPNEANFENLFSEFKNFIDKGDVAAFIFEPLVLGSAGMLIYSPEHLDQMISYAQKQGVVCIADEVFTGFGRTGKLFASDYLRHKPDIFALSKGLTGGTMAMGVTSCTADIINAYRSNDIMKTFFHGHSFTANPIACAASIASFNLLMMKECVHSIENITKWHHEVKLKWEVHPKVKEVRQLGTILALELLTNESSSYVNEVRHRLYPFFVERGVLLRPLGNVIYVLPPYVITKNEIVIVYNAIEALLASEII